MQGKIIVRNEFTREHANNIFINAFKYRDFAWSDYFKNKLSESRLSKSVFIKYMEMAADFWLGEFELRRNPIAKMMSAGNISEIPIFLYTGIQKHITRDDIRDVLKAIVGDNITHRVYILLNKYNHAAGIEKLKTMAEHKREGGSKRVEAFYTLNEMSKGKTYKYKPPTKKEIESLISALSNTHAIRLAQEYFAKFQ